VGSQLILCGLTATRRVLKQKSWNLQHGGFDMFVRVVTYHALEGKDVEKWMATSAQELRGVKGMRRVEFFRNQSDPTQYGAIMLFRNRADLDKYKEEQAGTYQTMVRSVRETWCDNSKPVTEQIYEILDV
jgi:hypothetical protein